MKITGLIIGLLIASAPLFAQTTKSITPLPAEVPQSGTKAGATHAVVVGISDYQDPEIPDLHYADKDAEAFANFLRSPAGGALDDDHLKLLSNKTATLAKFAAALDWLLDVCNEGDEAIVYFSGHGDVERKTMSQPGYLLCWDAPSHVYMAGGAFNLRDLEEIVATLSTQKKVRTIVIADACHAGKLSGSDIGGAQITGASLARQYANEVKILSCQPNEFSVESEQWGGGRGAFSFHLVDGLLGLADRNTDLGVTVGEIDRYLEDHVTPEVAPQIQVPVVLGNKTERLAIVSPEVLTALKTGRAGQLPVFSKAENRGLEDDVLASVDSSTRRMYLLFKKALEEKDFFAVASGTPCADYYFEKLLAEPKMARLHNTMRRNYAAALQEEPQQVINKLLKTDPATVDNIWANPIKYDHVPAQLHRAAELLGERHYVYKSLKAKELYFQAKKTRKENYPDWSLDSIKALKKNLLRQGISYDTSAAYLYEGFSEFMYEQASGAYLAKVVELAPNWAIGHYSLAGFYSSIENYTSSIQCYKEAIRLDSNFLTSYRAIAWAYEMSGHAKDAYLARETYTMKASLDIKEKGSAFTAFELNAMGNVLWRLRRYKDAEKVLNEAIKRTNAKYKNSFGNLLGVLADEGKFEEYVQIFDKYCTETHVEDNGTVGDVIYYYLHDPIRAEYYYKISIEAPYEDYKQRAINTFGYAHFCRTLGKIDKALAIITSLDHPDFWYLLERAEILIQSGKSEEARPYLDSIVQRAKPVFIKGDNAPAGYFGGPAYMYKIIALHRLGKTVEMEKAISTALAAPDCDGWRHFWLACTLAQIGRLDEAMHQLELSEKAGWEPNPAIWFLGTTKDFNLDPLRHLPEFQAWEKRWSPPYKDYSKD